MRHPCRPVRRRRSRLAGRLACLLVSSLAVVAAPAAGQDPSPSAPAAPWYQAVSFNAFLSASASLNANRPDSRTNQFRVFDFDDASLKIDVVEFVFQKRASRPNEVGFRVDLAAGASIPRVIAASGLFRDAAGTAGDFDVPQAFMTYVAPAGHGLTIDVGKFVTIFDYEVIEGYGGYNDNFSHSFLFGYAEPATHTGVRLTYPVSDAVGVQVLAVNGWDNVRDNNRGKSLGAQLAFTPGGRGSVFVNYMAGPEQAGNNSHLRQLFNVDGTLRATAHVSLAFNADLGRESAVPAPAGADRGIAPIDASWRGVAGYARFTASPRIALAVRGEVFDDADGVRTGVAQVLKAVTVTPEFRVHPAFVVRGEVRHDWSDHAVFEARAGGTSHRQTTVAVNTLVVF
jgi:Putative beta-barrel porin-2, OmpL-like. bbp2